MADVAEIGFVADTSGLTQAAQALDKLAPAASKAEAATKQVDAALDKAGAAGSSAATGIGKAETALEQEARAAQQASNALQQHAAAANAAGSKIAKAANDNANIAKGSIANVTAQFQDIAVTAAGGMNPLSIALQQGTQLASVLQTMDRPLQGLAQGFKMLVGVVPMVTIGLIALVAAGLQFINWTKLAQVALNFIADILPKVANYAVVAGIALAAAFAPSIGAAIVSIGMAITRFLITSLVALITTVGIIPTAFIAAIAGAVAFHNEISKLIGVDLAANVKKGANYIVASFMAAYEDIKLVWKNFPNIIGAAAVGAANLNIRAINAMIQAATDGINVLISGVNKLLSVGGIGEKLGFGSLSELSAPKLPELNNTFSTALAEGFQDREKIIADQFEKDWIGGISKGITKAATKASGMIRKFAAGLGKKDGDGSGDGEETDPFERIVRNAEARIAKMQAEQQALTLSAEAAAKLKYETDLLNQAKKADIDLTDEQRTKLMGLAAQMAQTEVETKQLKDALDFGKDITKGFLTDFLQGIKNGESVFKSFGNAALNVLNKISDKLISMAVDSLFTKGSGGGLGGLLGGIGKLLFGGGSALGDAFTAGGKVSRFANGGAFTNGVYSRPTLFQYANGGAFGVMGEAGPEAVMPLKRGPDGSLGVQMHADNGNGSQPVSISAPVYNTYRIEGAVTSGEVMKMVKDASQQSVDQVRRQIIPWINQYNQDGALL